MPWRRFLRAPVRLPRLLHPPDPTGSFPTTVPDEVLRHKRALYAVSIDEPLTASDEARLKTFADAHG